MDELTTSETPEGKKEIAIIGKDEADPRAYEYTFLNGRYIIELKHPFEFGKETYRVLKLRKPKAKHMRRMKADPDFHDMLRMVETLSDESRHVIDELDPQDASDMVEFVGSFF